MKLLSRVVWSEGMYLGPHHFQAHAAGFFEVQPAVYFLAQCQSVPECGSGLAERLQAVGIVEDQDILGGHILDNTRFPADWREQVNSCCGRCEGCSYCEEALREVLIRGVDSWGVLPRG